MGTSRLKSRLSLLVLAFAVAMLVFPAMAFAQAAPTIQSDKADYAPGETVTLTGSNWQSGESVNIFVNDDQGQTWSRNVNVTADASGNISDSFNLPDWFVATYKVTATGAQSGVATTSFTDANVTYSPSRVPASGFQNVSAGKSFDFKVTLAKQGGGNDPKVNTPFVVTNPTGDNKTAGTCGEAKTAIPASWLSVVSPTVPRTITDSAVEFTFRVTPEAGMKGLYTGRINLTTADGGSQTFDLCLDVVGDSTPPTSTATATANNSSYTDDTWTKHNVTVSLNASDNQGGSGVQELVYSATGAQQIASTTVAADKLPAEVAINTEGTTTISYSAKDKAGNTETTKTFKVKIDKTAPSISPGDVNDTTWRNTGLSQGFTTSDAGSGLASNQGLDANGGFTLTASAESTKDSNGNIVPTTVSKTVSDVAGNSTTRKLSAKIDKTAPAPNCGSASTNWLGSDASVACAPTDGLSGLANSGDASFNLVTSVPGGTETNNASTNSRDIYDVAGNKATAGPISGNMIDKKAPSLTYVDQTAASANYNVAGLNGWFKSPVEVRFSASDGGSGLAAGVTSPFTRNSGAQEGSAVTVASGAVKDAVGNENPGIDSTASFKIDMTAPSISAALKNATGGPISAAASGWFNKATGAPKVVFTCSDGGSGLATGACPADSDLFGSSADPQSYSRSVTDQAGNSASAGVSGVKVDLIDPQVTDDKATTQPNGAGWYKTDVTNKFSAVDAHSGLANAADATTSKTTQGEGTAVKVNSGDVYDKAGNKASADSAGFKIDLTNPKAGHSLSANANPNGWHKANVTVELNASDKDASGLNDGSGVKEIRYSVNNGQAQLYNPTNKIPLTTDGEYAIKYSATDNADRVSDQGSVTVKLDKTAPTIQGSRSPQANAKGWNNQDVTVSFACADTGGSGVDSCSGPTTLSNEGANQSVTGNVADLAGNTNSTQVSGINIDKTAIPSKASANSYSNSSPITVNYNTTPAANELSGLEKVELWAKGPNDANFSKVAENTTDANGSFSYTVNQGDGDYRFYTLAVDNAGNREIAPATPDAVVTVTHDTAKPSISVTHTADGTNGWNTTSPVALAVSASDDGSGLAADPTCKDGNNALLLTAGSTAGSWTASVSGEGVHNVSCSVSDKATNPNSANDTVKIDTAAPVIQDLGARKADGTADAPTGTDAAGLEWYNHDITNVFRVSDATSGFASGTDNPYIVSKPITAEGRGLKVASGTVTDLAGNTAQSKESAAFNIDKTKPVAEYTGASPAANANGWHNANVTAYFKATDTLSGFNATGELTKTGSTVADTEGKGVTVSSPAFVDQAGNEAVAVKSASFNIDKTKPVVSHTLLPAPNGNGWNNGDVTVSFKATDALSGFDSAGTLIDNDSKLVTGEGSAIAVNSKAFVDQAGNSVSGSTTVNIDRTDPTITAAAKKADGSDYVAGSWTNQNVRVSFTCADALSGIALNACPVPVDITSSTAKDGQNISGSVADRAGNAKSSIAINVKVDKTAPTVSLTGVVSGGTYLLGAANPVCATQDALSDVKTHAALSITGGPVGQVTATCSGAEDNAGNGQVAPVSVTYNVIYKFSGFFKPVENKDSSGNWIMNVAKAGQAIPLKWRITDANDNPVTNLSTAKLTVSSLNCSLGTTLDNVEEYAAGSSGLQNLGDGYYQINWKSPSTYAGSCKTLNLDMGEGLQRQAQFKFTK